MQTTCPYCLKTQEIPEIVKKTYSKETFKITCSTCGNEYIFDKRNKEKK